MAYTIKPLNCGELRACNGMGAIVSRRFYERWETI